jgi:hypothetical protein
MRSLQDLGQLLDLGAGKGGGDREQPRETL